MQPMVNREGVLCWRSNHYPALLLSRFPLRSVKIFRVIYIILPGVFSYKSSANLNKWEVTCSSWFPFTLRTIFLQEIWYTQDPSWFYCLHQSFKCKPVMFMGEQFIKALYFIKVQRNKKLSGTLKTMFIELKNC